MNMFTPAEVTSNYIPIGKQKTEVPASKLFPLAILAGFFVAIAAFASTIVSHSIQNPAVARLLSGMVFPIGIAMVMVTGAELFTGNALILISILSRENTVKRMLRNWFFVYTGNFVGALLLAAGNVFSGHLDYSTLAVSSISIAVGKIELGFGSAIILGIFCNLLVCIGVFCSVAAKDVTGRMIGAILPVVVFVVAAFEHSVANMYYLPTALFAMQVPRYAEAAQAAGIDTSMLTWGNALVRNLLPVTIGNILGGFAIALVMWNGFLREGKQKLHMKDVAS